LREVTHDDVNLGQVAVVCGDHHLGAPTSDVLLSSLAYPLAVELDQEVVSDPEHGYVEQAGYGGNILEDGL
jgi:hypothetical protein